jgi:hypothetical protein
LLDRHSPRWRLTDGERKTLAEKGKPLGKLLGEVLTIAQPTCRQFCRDEFFDRTGYRLKGKWYGARNWPQSLVPDYRAGTATL